MEAEPPPELIRGAPRPISPAADAAERDAEGEREVETESLAEEAEPAIAEPRIAQRHEPEPQAEPTRTEDAPTMAATPPELEPTATEAPSDDELTVIALREPISSDPALPTVEALKLSLEMLPMQFGANWKLDRRPNPVTGETQCLLASNAVNIFDGYEHTDVRVHLSSASIYVETDSNIDLTYPETGLRLDQGRVNPFDRVEKRNNVVISGKARELLAQMTQARDIVVRLGFWPTWPMTSTQEISFRLERFPDALKALKACDEM